MDAGVFESNVKALYGARSREIGPGIIGEWFKLAQRENWTEGEMMRGFDELRASADEWPNPGKMKNKIDAMRPKYSVDALPAYRDPLLETPRVEPNDRRCACGQRAVNFGYTPITLCGGCLWKLMLKPRSERIALGREAGIPVKEDGTV